MAQLSASEHRLLLAIAGAAMPAGRVLPAAGEEAVAEALRGLEPLGDAAIHGFRALFAIVEANSRARGFSGFAALPFGRRVELLESWNSNAATRNLLRATLAPLKLAHFGSVEVHSKLGLRHTVPQPAATEKPRWLPQVTDGRTLPDGEELECDVVIVGTGAGGAPVAYELARAGLAVLLIEEGDHHPRQEFNGRPVEMMRRLYRNAGVTYTVGNCFIPLPLGRTVGGTTTINSGTCLRPTDDVLQSWGSNFGLAEITPEVMAPWFEQVEKMLGVEEGTASAIGATGRIIARGSDTLGYSHKPLTRNAPGCDGQGLCVFGCPTEAKRSTNISYVPAALSRGAQLVTNLKVRNVILDGETAVGVEAVARSKSGDSIHVRVRAKVVVIACGTVHTPGLLLSQGLANASGELGKNLSIHPAAHMFALMDESVNPTRSIPQGYAIDEFHKDGLMFEGGTLPMEMFAATFAGVGPSFTSLMENFDRLCTFGFMVKDSSRGRVRPGPLGEPVITYFLNDRDVRQLSRGMDILARVFSAAGARKIFPGVAGVETLRSVDDVDQLARRRFTARDFDLSAYHPLGTARMGSDPLRSVVDSTQESHDVHNMWICDGSVVPGSLGVNPQVTIMALASRAAGYIARRVEKLSRRETAQVRAA